VRVAEFPLPQPAEHRRGPAFPITTVTTVEAAPHTRSPPSAVATAEAVRSGQVSASDFVAGALQRLETTDRWVRAFVDVDPAGSRAAAAGMNRARGGGTGRLAGVPIAVKGRAGPGSAQVRRLVAEGAIVIGTTSTPRGTTHQTWGHTDRGPTRNPRRPDLSPGGSSAGSAAAVAAGVVALATGTDGAGSSRIPAAWCGIFGYKPTTALAVPAGPAVPAVPAPLARDPRDLRLWADVVLNGLPPAGDPATAVWSPDLGYAAHELDPEVVAVAHAAAQRLADRSGLRWTDTTVELLDPATAWSALRDPAATGADRRAAAAVRAHNNDRLAALFSRAGMLLTPTTPAGPHGHAGPGPQMSVALTWTFNLSGHPALSIPAGATADGVPVGLQVIARPGADRALLDLAATCPPAAPAPARPAQRYP